MKEFKTLKDIRAAAPFFGPKAVEFIEDKIKKSPIGEDDEVIAADSQVLFLLAHFLKQEPDNG